MRRARPRVPRVPIIVLACLLACLLVAGDACRRLTPVTLGAAWTAWDEGAFPNYWRRAGAAEVGSVPAPGEVEVLPLDYLGRARGASALVTKGSADAGTAREREDMSEVFPSGWGANEVVEIALAGGRSYRGYFWNRSHLVAKSLGGPDVVGNVVMGTRMQNVGANDGKGGMSFGERLVRDWLERNPDGAVYYRATPVYEADEPVCRSVLVDIRSMEAPLTDTLDMRLEVYNAAAGYTIDYATGTMEAEGP